MVRELNTRPGKCSPTDYFDLVHGGRHLMKLWWTMRWLWHYLRCGLKIDCFVRGRGTPSGSQGVSRSFYQARLTISSGDVTILMRPASQIDRILFGMLFSYGLFGSAMLVASQGLRLWAGCYKFPASPSTENGALLGLANKQMIAGLPWDFLRLKCLRPSASSARWSSACKSGTNRITSYASLPLSHSSSGLIPVSCDPTWTRQWYVVQGASHQRGHTMYAFICTQVDLHGIYATDVHQRILTCGEQTARHPP